MKGRGALPDFEWGKRVHVHLGRRVFDGTADIQIGVAGVLGVDAALHAYLGGAASPCLGTTTRDLVEVEVVGCTSQILAELALGEGAELTLEVADVGVVDIAIDDIGDLVAIDLAAQRVGRSHDGHEVVTPRGEQFSDLRLVERLAPTRPGAERRGPRRWVQGTGAPEAV